jgi:hypothetical protein
VCLEMGIPWEGRLKKGGEDENVLFLKKGKHFMEMENKGVFYS